MSNNFSFIPEVYDCSNYTVSSALGIAYSFTRAALLVPLYTFILYLGSQKWKQQRSFTTASHSDVFTYHLSAFTLLGVFASVLQVYRVVASRITLSTVNFLLCMTWYGESYIHVLTCLEQYLAVVHPLVYMRLRNARGVRIRNISIGCVWILTLVSATLVVLCVDLKVTILFVIPFAVCLVTVSFCCLSVRLVLIRPGPGEGGRVDQSKQRAFHTITAILVVLWLWLGGILFVSIFYITLPVRQEVKCAMLFKAFWFNLPSGLVSPLLYLHRAGKLSLCCHNHG